MLGLKLRPAATLSLISPESIAYDAYRLSAVAFAPNGTAWPSANLAIAYPISLGVATRVRKFGWLNGGTASGNIDVGLYTAAGTRIASTGSTAQAGTNTIQHIDVSDFDLAPGLYYLAMAMDNTTGTNQAMATWTTAVARMVGVVEMASAFPLPTTFTPATPSNNYVPFCWATVGRFA